MSELINSKGFIFSITVDGKTKMYKTNATFSQVNEIFSSLSPYPVKSYFDDFKDDMKLNGFILEPYVPSLEINFDEL